MGWLHCKLTIFFDNWRKIMEESKVENTETKINLNGKELTVEQFEEEKKRLTEKKVKIVEVATNTYKTRLTD